jgi:hypothetical protein
MPLRKVEEKKLPIGVYVVVIILFILAGYLIFLGISSWHKYYFNPPVMNSSQVSDIKARFEARGLTYDEEKLNHTIAWTGLFPGLIVGLFFVFAGVSLLRKKNWARKTIIVISLIICLMEIIAIISFTRLREILYAVVGLCVGIYLLFNKKVKLAFIINKKQGNTKKQKKELKGLGGWLILIQIFFISGVISYLIYFILLLFSHVYSDYSRIMILILSLLSVIALVLNGIVILLMYNKRKEFPVYAMILLCCDVIITFFLFNIFISIINLIVNIIIIYCLQKSKRVKNTFVN